MTAEGRKPAWLRVPVPSGDGWKKVDEALSRRALHTVCDEAACPNKAECWGRGTATFMVLGDVCTRNCRFCAVSTAKAGTPPDSREPEGLAGAVEELKLSWAVITSVDRDDLPDRGAGHFARCVEAIRARVPSAGIEALIPDFRGAELETLARAGPDVIAHNVETVRRLQGIRDARASFDASLATLEGAARAGIVAKSSMMLGLGESEREVHEAMDELVSAGCSSLVLGQYLRPTLLQVPVVEYLEPDRFDAYAAEARARGFAKVVAAPLARTSYHAGDANP